MAGKLVHGLLEFECVINLLAYPCRDFAQELAENNYIASLDEAEAEAYRVSLLLGVIIVFCGVDNSTLEPATKVTDFCNSTRCP